MDTVSSPDSAANVLDDLGPHSSLSVLNFLLGKMEVGVGFVSRGIYCHMIPRPWVSFEWAKERGWIESLP